MTKFDVKDYFYYEPDELLGKIVNVYVYPSLYDVAGQSYVLFLYDIKHRKSTQPSGLDEVGLRLDGEYATENPPSSSRGEYCYFRINQQAFYRFSKVWNESIKLRNDIDILKILL